MIRGYDYFLSMWSLMICKEIKCIYTCNLVFYARVVFDRNFEIHLLFIYSPKLHEKIMPAPSRRYFYLYIFLTSMQQKPRYL